jgi:hypothetical protein
VWHPAVGGGKHRESGRLQFAALQYQVAYSFLILQNIVFVCRLRSRSLVDLDTGHQSNRLLEYDSEDFAIWQVEICKNLTNYTVNVKIL